MTVRTNARKRWVALLLATTLIAGCGLPRTGPTKDEIYNGSVQEMGNAYVVVADDRVTKLVDYRPDLGFGAGFLQAGVIGSDTVKPGDTLGLAIWENVDDGLLASAGSNQAQLESIQVDDQGFIFVPYAGRIRAAGNSPEAIRRIITEKLEAQTPDPQVLVRRVAGDGATVSIIGNVGNQGVFPIERPTRTLTAMLAAAGGISEQPESTQVSVIRGHHTGTIWLEDLFRNPRLDIALRAGDRILVEQDERFFTALGATGAQVKVPFEERTVSGIEALSLVGGLSPNLADPTGIFVFRDEPAEVANAVLGRSDLFGTVRIVYVLDLTQPNGVFIARDFTIHDEDTVYVTEAPYSQFNKVLRAIVTPLGPIAQIDRLAD